MVEVNIALGLRGRLDAVSGGFTGTLCFPYMSQLAYCKMRSKHTDVITVCGVVQKDHFVIWVSS